MRLETRATLCAKYGLTDAQLERITASPLMQQLIRDAEAEWGGAANTAERIRLKSGMGLEEVIPLVVALAADVKSGVSNRLDAVRLLHDLSGLRKQEAMQAASPERFTLVMNIGDVPITIEHGPAVPAEPK